MPTVAQGFSTNESRMNVEVEWKVMHTGADQDFLIYGVNLHEHVIFTQQNTE